MSYKPKFTVGQREVSSYAEELAWKRAGFKNREAIYDAVRELPIEKKVEMLTEIHMADMRKMLFEEKQEFLIRLGKKTWVDSEELHEYAKKTYPADAWTIDSRDFHSVCICEGAYMDQLNLLALRILKEKRNKGNKND